MSEKVEWEVVDDSARKSGQARSTGAAAQALLGPWWRWKLAGMVGLGVIALILVMAAAGVIAIVIALAGLLTLGLARLMQWLRGKQNSQLVRRGYGPPPHQ